MHSIVEGIRCVGGRFLKSDQASEKWVGKCDHEHYQRQLRRYQDHFPHVLHSLFLRFDSIRIGRQGLQGKGRPRDKGRSHHQPNQAQQEKATAVAINAPL